MQFEAHVAIMSSLAVFLILVLVILMEMRMVRIMRKLEEISRSTAQLAKLDLSSSDTHSEKEE